jgi:uncharacterized protein (DUF433 family)
MVIRMPTYYVRSTTMAAHHPASTSHIVRDPEVQGGEPTISGTRIPVRVIVVAHRYFPDLDRLCEGYPPLTPGLVQEALTYYAANRAEIDAVIAINVTDTD